MDYPTGLWTTVYDMIDEDGQRVLFKRYESLDEPKYMLDYPFGCFTACVILEPISDDMKNWKGTMTCFLAEGCSEMFEHLVAEFDKTFAINGVDGETGRYDSKDFETNLYSSAKSACSEWLNKIKTWNVRYNEGVNKMSFNDMVQKQRQKNNQLIKNLYGDYGEIRQIKKERYELENPWIYLRANQINDLYRYEFDIKHTDCYYNYSWYIYQKKEDDSWQIVLFKWADDPYIEQCWSLDDAIRNIDEKAKNSPNLCSSVTHL